jgi:hypothetical protein
MALIRCPFCAEEIQQEAIKCKHCGEFLNKPVPSVDDRVDNQPSSDNMRVLREGTEFRLTFLDSLSSQSATVGDRVSLALAEEIREGDYILAESGAPAVGSVIHAKRSGMLGRGGELNVRLDYLKLGKKRVPLRASKGQQGDSKTGATIGLSILFGPFGLMKRGASVEISEGTSVSGYVDGDTAIEAKFMPEFFCPTCRTMLSAEGAKCAECERLILQQAENSSPKKKSGFFKWFQ